MSNSGTLFKQTAFEYLKAETASENDPDQLEQNILSAVPSLLPPSSDHIPIVAYDKGSKTTFIFSNTASILGERGLVDNTEADVWKPLMTARGNDKLKVIEDLEFVTTNFMGPKNTSGLKSASTIFSDYIKTYIEYPEPVKPAGDNISEQGKYKIDQKNYDKLQSIKQGQLRDISALSKVILWPEEKDDEKDVKSETYNPSMDVESIRNVKVDEKGNKKGNKKTLNFKTPCYKRVLGVMTNYLDGNPENLNQIDSPFWKMVTEFIIQLQKHYSRKVYDVTRKSSSKEIINHLLGENPKKSDTTLTGNTPIILDIIIEEIVSNTARKRSLEYVSNAIFSRLQFFGFAGFTLDFDMKFDGDPDQKFKLNQMMFEQYLRYATTQYTDADNILICACEDYDNNAGTSSNDKNKNEMKVYQIPIMKGDILKNTNTGGQAPIDCFLRALSTANDEKCTTDLFNIYTTQRYEDYVAKLLKTTEYVSLVQPLGYEYYVATVHMSSGNQAEASEKIRKLFDQILKTFQNEITLKNLIIGGDSNVYYGGKHEYDNINALATYFNNRGYNFIRCKHHIEKKRPQNFATNAQAFYKGDEIAETMFMAYPSSFDIETDDALFVHTKSKTHPKNNALPEPASSSTETQTASSICQSILSQATRGGGRRLSRKYKHGGGKRSKRLNKKKTSRRKRMSRHRKGTKKC